MKKSRVGVKSESASSKLEIQLLEPDLVGLRSHCLAAEWRVAVGFQLVMNSMRSGGSVRLMGRVIRPG